jgi:2-keto-myo-inositol isomerase
MELCFNLQTSMNSTLEQDVKLCSATGFRWIEINLAKARAYLSAHSMSELKELLDQYHVKCATINAIFEISFCDERKWRRVRVELEEAGALGEALNAKGIIVLTDEQANIREKKTEQEIFEDTCSVLIRMADVASRYGMMIGLEPVGTMLVSNLSDAWDIVRKVDRADIGLVLDDFNLYLWDLDDAFNAISCVDAEKIMIAHINDAEKLPFAVLNQEHRCMPGDGRIDVEYYVSCLRKSGYDGLLSVEVLNPDVWAMGPEKIIPEAYRKAGQFLSREHQTDILS